MKAQDLLNSYGYQGEEILLDPLSEFKQTAQKWAEEVNNKTLSTTEFNNLIRFNKFDFFESLNLNILNIFKTAQKVLKERKYHE